MRILNHKWLFSLLVFVTFVCFAGDPRIGNNYALVIIDMQPKFVTRGGNDQVPENIKKVKEIIENQKQMIAMAKKQNIPIIFIEYKDFGDTNSELKKESEGYDNVKYFTKNTDGMFDSYNTNEKQISDYLRSQEIGNLIITGANGGACVSESIDGALKNNYNVLAYTNGIADFNYEAFIFPYVKQYDFKPTCESCSFREINEHATIALEVMTKKIATTSPEVNDSSRTVIKDKPVVQKTPVKKTVSKAKPKPAYKPKTEAHVQ
jgi:nicotinamidase-related amidase